MSEDYYYNSTVKQLIAERSKIGITTPYTYGNNIGVAQVSCKNCSMRMVPRESGRIMLCIRCDKIVLTEELKKTVKPTAKYAKTGHNSNQEWRKGQVFVIVDI